VCALQHPNLETDSSQPWELGAQGRQKARTEVPQLRRQSTAICLEHKDLTFPEDHPDVF